MPRRGGGSRPSNNMKMKPESEIMGKEEDDRFKQDGPGSTARQFNGAWPQARSGAVGLMEAGRWGRRAVGGVGEEPLKIT